MNSWPTSDYAPHHASVNPATWPPITGDPWRCESCPQFTRWPGPPWGNSGTCAELKRRKLDSHVTIPGSCVAERRLALEAEHTRRMAIPLRGIEV